MSFMGKILRVNLTTGNIATEPFPAELAKDYVGGRGLATRILTNEISADCDPLGPDNKLIFATGPLTNTIAPTGGRYMVVTKGPLTNTIASSNSGGQFGAYLKKAGWDMIIFEGVSPKPVYLRIENDKVELKDAEHVWGKRVDETTHALIDEFGNKNAKVSCIGPAGENLVLFASIMNEIHRAAGRTGVGAVMGSKKLKAVVAFGDQATPIADEAAFKAANKDKRAKLKENGVTGEGLPALGTKVLDNIINSSGMYPTRNFREVMFKGVEHMSGEALVEKGYLKRNTGCYMCPIQCARDVELPNGRKGEGPEYETGWAFGPMLDIDDLNVISDANFLCNELGLDTISCGVTIACAMDLFENGHIPPDDLGKAPPLKFGSSEALMYYMRQIAYREGFGDKMAMGSARLAKEYGHPEYSMTVKGQELAAYDPRGVQGHALAYATGNRGADHVRCYMISDEIIGMPEKLDPQVIEGKPEKVKWRQDYTAVIDSAGLCLFTSFALSMQDYADLINGATGWNYSADEYLKIGERIWNMERVFNLESGITGKDDTLPVRVMTEVPTEGPNKGKLPRIAEMLPIYYKARGWSEDGVPGQSKLTELGLKK